MPVPFAVRSRRVASPAWFAASVALLSWFGTTVHAAETPKLPPGSPAPAWSDLPGADGKKHSLGEWAGKKAVVVVFFENRCPDCRLYSSRIKSLADDYASRGVATVLIAACKSPEHTTEAMAKVAAERGFTMPYLLDSSQAVGKAFGATVSPQTFVLDGERRVVYQGAIDDHWKKPEQHYVRAALDAVLAGKPVATPVTTAEGCFIEYD